MKNRPLLDKCRSCGLPGLKLVQEPFDEYGWFRCSCGWEACLIIGNNPGKYDPKTKSYRTENTVWYERE